MSENENEDLAATEARLRDAIGARTGAVEGTTGDDGLGAIKGRLAEAAARDRRRRQALMVLGVAAAIVIVAGSIALLRDDGKNDKLQTTSTDATTTSRTEPSTTAATSTTSATVPVPQTDNGIWPPASSASRSFDSPEAATFSFATEYLHMNADVVQVGTPGPSGDGEQGDVIVPVNPFATGFGGPTTVVELQQTARGFVVLGARTDDIQVETPKVDDPANDPLIVSGKSTAFEAVINLELRTFESGDRVGDVESTMGGSNGELGPFSTTLHPPKDQGPLVLLVYEADASGQGEISAATVISLGAPNGGGGSAAPGPAPTTYLALSKSGDITRLDFEGHVQTPVGSVPNGEQLAYDPASERFAVELSGSSPCNSRELRLFGFDESDVVTIPDATSPAFSPDGSKLAYVDCATGIHLRDVTTGADAVLGDDGGAIQFVALTWSDDSTVVASAGEGGLLFFDPQTGDRQPIGAGIHDSLIAGRGRFGTIAYFDGAIRSYNPADGTTVTLVTPPRRPVTLDADASGGNLLWVDANGDVWTWSGGEPSQVASGMAAAAW